MPTFCQTVSQRAFRTVFEQRNPLLAGMSDELCQKHYTITYNMNIHTNRHTNTYRHHIVGNLQN